MTRDSRYFEQIYLPGTSECMSRYISTRSCQQIKFRKRSIFVVEYQAMKTRTQHSQEHFLLSPVFKTTRRFRSYLLWKLVCSRFRNVVFDLNIGDNRKKILVFVGDIIYVHPLSEVCVLQPEFK